MSLRDKQVYESNLLAFKFSLIVQFFELLSTIVYQAGRVGFMNTVAMMIMQAIVLAATIVGYIKFRSSASGKYFNMICMLVGYTIVMVGSVHVPYLWAFGAALLILSLLYGDTKLTISSCYSAEFHIYSFISDVGRRHYCKNKSGIYRRGICTIIVTYGNLLYSS